MGRTGRYILTLHELLAHTPHEHVERNSLDYAKSKLEELSRIMHDEVSETENIRKNLAIERMIIEGCEILLDTSQTFVRQGSLIQVPMSEKGKITRGRLGSLSLKKEGERQCFLFSKHLIICTRGSGGKLHLTKMVGKRVRDMRVVAWNEKASDWFSTGDITGSGKNGVISLIDCTLLEDPESTEEEVPSPMGKAEYRSNVFRLKKGPHSFCQLRVLQLEAKGSGQDIDHLDFKIGVEPKDSPPFTVILVASSRQEKAAWTSDISQCVDNIRCNGLMMNAFEENSKVTVPQMIKSDASLYCDDVDIRFSKTMNSCKVLQIRYASVERLLERLTDLRFLSIDFLNTFLHSYRVFTTAVVVLDKLITIYRKPISAIPASEDLNPGPWAHGDHWRPPLLRLGDTGPWGVQRGVSQNPAGQEDPQCLRSLELLFASGQNNKLLYGDPPKSPRATRKFSSPPPLSITKTSSPSRRRKLSLNIPIITGGKALDLAALSCNSNGYTSMYSAMSPFSKATLDTSKLYVSSTFASKIPDEADTAPEKPEEPSALSKQKFPLFSYNNGVVMTSCRELDSNRSALSAASAFAIATAGANEGTPNKEKYRRMSLASTGASSPTPPPTSTALVLQRGPQRALIPHGPVWRGCQNPPAPFERSRGFPPDQRNGDKEFVIRRAATNRVLNVLRHWVSKHSQAPWRPATQPDFETNDELKCKVISFLEEVMHDPELLTQERKAAANIIRTLTQDDPGDNQITLEEITQMAEGVKAEPFENHSALEIAEQLTLLDHLVFKKIPYEEFFGQGWMKLEKNERTPYIMKTTKHFNDISNLIASEIIRNEDINARVSAIEKWVAVADICRCLHNYNAVLEITSSMNRSAIFRLKKTWLKVSKQLYVCVAPGSKSRWVAMAGAWPTPPRDGLLSLGRLPVAYVSASSRRLCSLPHGAEVAFGHSGC
ncbi:ras-specific guanine nucleotide-releasing factor 1 isoform 1 [Camelus ferus]|nr:ras-specific guanine nucleotide-releasing factor 1 isoform 1 [Camelus ferus]